MERLIDQGRKVKRSSAVRIGGCSAPATAVSALTFESSLVMDWATRVPRDAAQLHAKLKVAEDRTPSVARHASLACLARVWRTRVWRVSGVLYENFLYCFQGGPPGRSAADSAGAAVLPLRSRTAGLQVGRLARRVSHNTWGREAQAVTRGRDGS